MLFDSIKFSEGASVANFTVASGIDFPAAATNGELFLKLEGGIYNLYVYHSSAWNRVADEQSIETTLGYTPLNKAGDTMTGTLTLSGSPTIDLQAATKAYVDSTVSTASNTPTANIAGGQIGYIPYQTDVSTTGFISPSTAGLVLTSNGAGQVPTWQATASGGVSDAFDLTGTTLADNVIYSRLTSLGIVTGLQINNTINTPGSSTGISMTIQPGMSGSGEGGTVYILGGFTGTSPTAGGVIISGGQANASVTSAVGGDVLINGGLGGSSGSGGEIVFRTANTNSLTEKFRIKKNGTFLIGGQAGTAGYVLVSSGTGGPPTWQANINGGANTSNMTAVTSDAATSATVYPVWASALGVSNALKATPGFSFVPNTGTLTATKMVAGGNTVGFLEIPQVSQSLNYTCVLTDSGKHIFHPAADTTARTYTIPANATVAYPIGTAITFINQNGAGLITIAITSDVMRLAGPGTTGSRTLSPNGTATAVKITATEWLISGTNLT